MQAKNAISVRVFVCSVALAIASAANAQTTATLYVDDEEPGGDGETWATAMTDIQLAIDTVAGLGAARSGSAKARTSPGRCGQTASE